MNLMNQLNTSAKKTIKPRKERVSVLIGKAWVRDGAFSVAPLTEPVEGKEGEYQISNVYPFVVTDYCELSFGPNTKKKNEKSNTHWVFLGIEKDRVEEYKEMAEAIGQSVSE